MEKSNRGTSIDKRIISMRGELVFGSEGVLTFSVALDFALLEMVVVALTGLMVVVVEG